jgi:aspartate carbamoyltransferase regulatory subunit
MEKELKVAALRNGTVIDHIPAGQVFKVVEILHLHHYENQITIGNNLDSKKMGSKGIIKISDRYIDEAEANKIALVAPEAKINIIRNYEVVEKRYVNLPQEIIEIVHCPNPKCITNNDPVRTHFHVRKQANGQILLHCHYCEKDLKCENAKIN